MANVCEYKVIVKGKKNACYAFFGSMSCMGDKQILEESGTDEMCTIRFEGDCKWSVDSYCSPWDGGFPVVLPEDAEEAMAEAEDKYWYNTVQERSKMFEVEVWCNSADTEDYDPNKGPFEIFEHYINGTNVGGECPEVLQIKVEGFGESNWEENEDFEEDEDWEESFRQKQKAWETFKKIDLSAEQTYIKELFQNVSDEKLHRLIKKKQPGFLMGKEDILIEGKPNRDKIAEYYFKCIFDEGGQVIMNYEGFYKGDFAQFKEYIDNDIQWYF